MNRLKSHRRVQVLSLLLEGCSLRATAPACDWDKATPSHRNHIPPAGPHSRSAPRLLGRSRPAGTAGNSICAAGNAVSGPSQELRFSDQGGRSP